MESSKPTIAQRALVGYKIKHEDMSRGKGLVGTGLGGVEVERSSNACYTCLKMLRKNV